MSKTRVLIVASDAGRRRSMALAIEADPSLRVAGSVPSARLAQDRLSKVGADIVALSDGLSDSDSLDLVQAIRREHPGIPLLLLSTDTTSTLRALALGATDALTLPPGDETQLGPWLTKNLPGRLRQLTSLGGPRLPGRSREFIPQSRVDVVAIGSSTGGPNAVLALLSELPAPFPVPIVLVQHMPPDFTRQFAMRLSDRTPFSVREASGGELIEPGSVWIAPGDHHMTVSRANNEVRVWLNQGPAENSCRPAVDVLFRSVAQVYGSASLGIVLTGMGSDGTRGCEVLRASGAQILAQDEATSVVWGMPGSVVRAGLAHQVLPLEQIASELSRRVRRGRSASTIDHRSALVPRG